MGLAPRIDRLDKNLLINGKFDYWQRGVGPTDYNNTSGYPVDRWNIISTFTGGHARVSRVVSSCPTGNSDYALRISQVTANCTAMGEMSIRQVVEKRFLRRAWNKKLSYSFWVRSNRTGNSMQWASFANGNGIGTWDHRNRDFEILEADVWQKVTFVLDFNPNTFDASEMSGRGLYFDIQWNPLAVPIIAGVDYFEITEVSIIVGDNPGAEFCMAGSTPAEEFTLCQRYYQRDFRHSSVTGAYHSSGVAMRFATHTKMRVPPIVSQIPGTSLTNCLDRLGTGDYTPTGIPWTGGESENSIGVNFSGSFTLYQPVSLYTDIIQADAEL